MSINEKPAHPELTPDPLVVRYREASAAVNELPGSHVRDAVIAEAARLAREQNAPKPNYALAKKRAANDGAWRYAATASILVAGVAAFIVNQWQSGEAELVVSEAGRAASAPAESAVNSAATATATNTFAAERSPPPSVANQGTVAEVAPRVAAASSGETTPNVSTEVQAFGTRSQPAATAPARPQPAERVATPSTDVRSRKSESGVSGGDVARTESAPLNANTSREYAAASTSTPQIASAPAPAPAAPPAPVAIPTAPTSRSPIATGSAAVEVLPGARESANDAVGSAAGQSQKRATMQSTSEAREPAAPAAASAAVPRIGDMTDGMRRGMVIVQANGNLRAGVRQSDATVVQAALRAGADANLIETDGTPVLSIAIQRGATDVALALLRAGADSNRRDRQGKSARDYAEASGNRTVIEAMK